MGAVKLILSFSPSVHFIVILIFLFRCFKIWIDKISLFNSEFLFSKYVLNCGGLYIQNFKDSNYKPLINWLFGEPKIAKSINLLGCGW